MIEVTLTKDVTKDGEFIHSLYQNEYAHIDIYLMDDVYYANTIDRWYQKTRIIGDNGAFNKFRKWHGF